MAAEGIENETGDSDVAPAVPSTQRRSLTRYIPPEWLDRLTTASAALPPMTPLDEALSQLVAAAREALGDAAIGVCVAGEGGQLVVRDASRPSRTDPPGPSRLFPEYEMERAIPLVVSDGRGGVDEGSTLHVAWDGEPDYADAGAVAIFLDRLAQVLGKVVGDHRASERTRAEAIGVIEAQMIQSEKLAGLGQIAAGVVHELNNPLTSIVAYSDFLMKKLAQSPSVDAADVERLARINEAAARILRFARDLTEYARPSREVPAPVAIHEVLDRALVFCEHELILAGVTIERDFGEVPAVRGVAGQLTQVFVNLFTNAAHAMRGQGGLLKVATREAGDGGVRITIRDDGHGIEPDALPRIFDPFFTTKTDGSGTGLGLSIVRNIVMSHGGRIHAIGNHPRGTIFHVELPRAALPDGAL